MPDQPQIPNPNSEYLSDADKHRIIFYALRYENAHLAKPGEQVIDIENGIFYVKGPDGLLHSKAHEVGQELQALKDAGVIQSALAYINNAEIYTLYVHDNKCRLDEMLRISNNIRYYSVRGTLADGDMNYITGNLVGNTVENVLVDVFPEPTSDPNNVYNGKAEEGHLHTPSQVIDGAPYFIDFYDSRRICISTVPCQVLKVARLDFSLSPDKNISSLLITTNQDMIDQALGDIAFVYQGQALNTLNVYVYARYPNGDTRYLNQEIASSRLIITIPETADTTQIGAVFEINAKYYTEEINNGQGGEFNDLNYASIDTTKYVKVVPDVFVGVKYLLPIPVARKNQVGTKIIKLYIFAMYNDHTNADVTNNARLTSTNFNNELFGQVQTFDLALGIGTSGYVYNEAGIKLGMEEDLLPRWILLQVSGAPQQTFSNVSAIVDPFTDPGTIHVKLKKDALNEFATTNEFQNIGAGPDPDDDQSTVLPTHFRMRSVLDSTFLHTITPLSCNEYNDFTIVDTNVLANKLEAFPANNSGIPYPVLLEFFKYDSVTQRYILISMHPAITAVQAWSQYGGTPGGGSM